MNDFAWKAQRKDHEDLTDFYPTPPWATRALMKYGFSDQERHDMEMKMCLEPACGQGHMARVLKEYFLQVDAMDIVDRGYLGIVQDFLTIDTSYKYNWVITNPPFSLAEEFVLKAFEVSTDGIAIFARTQLLEGKSRYKNLYSLRTPTYVMPFVGRVPLFKNRINRTGSTATSYSWFVWKDLNKPSAGVPSSEIRWIPPEARMYLEKNEDYET